MNPSIIVRRYPYEEPHIVQLDLIVSNGSFAARCDWYCSPDEIREIGEGLLAFPQGVPDEYQYEYGSEQPADKVYRYLLIRAFTYDGSGHSAIQVRLNLNTTPPYDGMAQFSIMTEPAQINRLGRLFVMFGELRHAEFHWDERDDEMFEYLVPESAV